MLQQQMQKTFSAKYRVTINSKLRRNGNEKMIMYFTELLTNFIGTFGENNENFH
jgi:hypothetical protein